MRDCGALGQFGAALFLVLCWFSSHFVSFLCPTPSLPIMECDKQEISDNKLLHSWVALQVFLEDAQKFRILRTMLMDEEM